MTVTITPAPATPTETPDPIRTYLTETIDSIHVSADKYLNPETSVFIRGYVAGRNATANQILKDYERGRLTGAQPQKVGARA